MFSKLNVQILKKISTTYDGKNGLNSVKKEKEAIEDKL